MDPLGCANTELPSCSPKPTIEAFGGISDAHPIALLNILFPGFGMMSDVLQKHVGIDLNIYIPVLAVLGGLIAAWQYFSDYVWTRIQTYFMSQVDIRTDDEIYNMLMAWVAEQGFSKRARRFVANTNLNSRSWLLWRWNTDDDDDDDDAGEDTTRMSLIGGKAKKGLAYTPTFGSHYFFYKGRLCIFRRDRGVQQAGSYLLASEKEEISVSCLGRDPWVLKELLHEARVQFLKRDAAKTLIYRGTCRPGSLEPTWQRMMARVSRPFSTVILNEKIKQDLISDVTDYLDPATRWWYANRGIPYRRGYLLCGPPGTGKSSLSLALAGFFRLRIYIVSLSSIFSTEENLAALFAELPRRCVVLLEDIDTAGLTHTREEDKPQQEEANNQDPAPKQGLRGNEKAPTTTTNTGFRLSLSGLLNILDGVASQEGRVLIMTTNHVEKLDKALIRPGRVDMTVNFGLADSGMTAALFRAIFAPLAADKPPTKSTPADKTIEAAAAAGAVVVVVAAAAAAAPRPEQVAQRLAHEKIQRDVEVAKIGELAEQFALKIPAHEFSPAELQGFLMKHKRDPAAALAGVDVWVVETRKEKVAKQVQEAEENKKAEEEAKKAEEEAKKAEEEAKKKLKEERKKSKKQKARRGNRRGKKGKQESSSETEPSSSDSSSTSDTKSEAEVEESKKRKSKSKSKGKKKNGMSIDVDKATEDGVDKVEPVSAVTDTTDRSDGFVDVEKQKCDEDASQVTV
ncbi:unnamed protein product [Discula destructiva]